MAWIFNGLPRQAMMIWRHHRLKGKIETLLSLHKIHAGSGEKRFRQQAALASLTG
jgi:hypothetical protein